MKKDLIGFIFGIPSVQEELNADLTRLFETAAKADEESLATRKTPLTGALKSIGVESAVEDDVEGFCICLPDQVSYSAAIGKLSEPDNLHKLAELGWVATKCGDQAMSNEPAELKIRFLEITTVATDDSEKAPNAEKIRKDAQKDDATEQERDDELNPVETDDKSGGKTDGVSKAKDGSDPEGTPKGSKKNESAAGLVDALLDSDGEAAYTGSMTENAYQNAVCPQCGTLASSTDKRGTYKCKCGFVGAPKILDKEEWMRHFKDTPDYRWVGSPRYLESIDKSEKPVNEASGRCPGCEIVNVNGVRTHEIGCPEAWKEYTHECKECGSDFKPANRYQKVCDDCKNPAEESLNEMTAASGIPPVESPMPVNDPGAKRLKRLRQRRGDRKY